MDSLKTLFLYLDAEDISIDTQEFEFQFNSHPDYPSLLALSDTLKFFNIENGAFKIEKAEMDLLPNAFVAKLKKETIDFLSFVERKENTFVYTNGTEQKHSASKGDLETIWDDVVLLAEKHSDDVSKPKTKNLISFLIPSLSFLLFISVISINLPSKWFLAFYVFPIIGVFLSVAALKDLFNTKSELLNKFCNVTSDSSCKTVVNSNKWKIFDTISLSDLSILFFATQICALLLMDVSENLLSYFYIQTFLLVLSLPVIIASLYYQKYIEKKWCPICLTIMGVLLLELVYVLYLNTFLDLNVSLLGVLLFLFVAAVIATTWFPLKKILSKVNQLKEEQIKANRFKRNYTMFKNMLMSSGHYNVPKSLLVFGNANAALNISIVTSPFCGHCTEPHYMLKSILEYYRDQLSISMLYNVNPANARLNGFVKTITELKLNKGEAYFYEAMEYWYQTKDDGKWHSKYGSKTGLNEIETILNTQHPWFSEHNVNFTPCLFINGYKYPKGYDLADLPFFIDELIEDRDFMFEESINKIVAAEKL